MLTRSEKFAFNVDPAIVALTARALKRQVAASAKLIFAILAAVEDNLA